MFLIYLLIFFIKQKTAYEMRISDWSSDVCSSDLSGSQPYAGPVRLVAELVSDQPHTFLGIGADVRRVLERPRTGRDAEPRHIGDRLERRQLPSRRLGRLCPVAVVTSLPSARKSVV